MTDAVFDPQAHATPGAGPEAGRKAASLGGIVVFGAVLLAGLAYAGFSIFTDTANVGEPLAIGAFLFLGLALLIALGFEFVNGFHDTANAVATVIYTHSLPPLVAAWFGLAVSISWACWSHPARWPTASSPFYPWS